MTCKCNDCRAHPPVRLYSEAEPRIYRIIRFRFNGRPRAVRSNVTLTEAQAHCEREDTRKAGAWFDGYDYMPGCRPRE